MLADKLKQTQCLNPVDAPTPGPLERAANDKKCQAGEALFEGSRFFCNPATSPGNTVTR